MNYKEKPFLVVLALVAGTISLLVLNPNAFSQGGANQTTISIPTDNWQNYSNPIYGLTIRHPQGWHVEEGEHSLDFGQPAGTSEDGTPKYKYLLRLGVFDIENNETLQMIFRDDISSLRFSKYVENFSLLNTSKIKSDNGVELSEYQYKYDVPTTKEHTKGLGAVAVNNGLKLKYYLSYQTLENEFENNIQIINAMIRSFGPAQFG